MLIKLRSAKHKPGKVVSVVASIGFLYNKYILSGCYYVLVKSYTGYVEILSFV